MSVAIAPDFEAALLDEVRANFLDDAIVKLFQNDFSPNEDSINGDFTECDFSGYASKDLSVESGSWAAAGDAGKYKEITFSSTLEYVHDGGATGNLVYGYYVQTAGGTLLYSERFETGPFVMTNNGDQIDIDLSLTMRSEFNQVSS